MTPERVRQLVAMTGEDRPALARMLGYKSENSLRQCEDGKATLRPDRAAWLEAYAKFRMKQASALTVWLRKNPPPGQNND